MNLLFDCDGTLVDSERLAFSAFQKVAKDALSLELTPEIWVEEFLGFTRAHCLERLESLFGKALPDDLPQQIVSTLRPLLEAELVAISGVAQTLRNLAFPKFIVSNASVGHIEFVLGKTGLREHFSSFHSPTTGKSRPKPAPDVYLRAVGELRLNASECIVVEDSIPGVQAAVAAGLTVIAFASQVPRHRLEAEGADHVIESFSEIVKVIELVHQQRSM
ncbi:HAD family hydrolase [Pseudomonas sp. NY11955]|uniref:HAD family hydrolase n=1 Tax=Pseudomonas sp. NY11955 TaxID=3400363 RepID=UPI003A87CAED